MKRVFLIGGHGDGRMVEAQDNMEHVVIEVDPAPADHRTMDRNYRTLTRAVYEIRRLSFPRYPKRMHPPYGPADIVHVGILHETNFHDEFVAMLERRAAPAVEG